MRNRRLGATAAVLVGSTGPSISVDALQSPPLLSKELPPRVDLATWTLDSSTTTSLPDRHVRWKSYPVINGTVWDMQTAVTVFQRNTTGAVDIVELHAQLHLGEPRYFEYYNSREFNARYDAILFELLVDEDVLGEGGLPPGAHVIRPVTASPSDQITARQYGWTCQVDVVNYSQPTWVHADLTRQQFLERLSRARTLSADKYPLWQLARTRTPPLLPDAAIEAATAFFVGPPLVESTATAPNESLLFWQQATGNLSRIALDGRANSGNIDLSARLVQFSVLPRRWVEPE